MPVVALPDGGRVAYQVDGDGEPLLLVMGTGGDRAFWGAQVPTLSRSLSVVTYDSRGTGASSDFARREDCTPATLAADAAAIIDHLGRGPAHVAGLSLGACVAQELALSRPDAVRSLALHGAWARTDEWFVRMIEMMEHGLERGGLAAYARLITCWIMSPEFHHEHAEAVLGMERDYVVRRGARVEGVLAHCHADRVHDTLDRLPTLRVPTLVTVGELDIQVPPRYNREVAAAIPGTRVLELTGRGSSHLACVERPDEWNALTLEFIRSTRS